MKECSKCKVIKDDNEFGCKPKQCKKCVADQKRDYVHRIGKYKTYRGDPIEDLSGKVFNDLTVIRWTTIKDKHFRYWLCKCICGKEVEIIHADLTCERIKSCGCRRSRTGEENHLWKGCGDISGAFWSKVKHGAKQRKLHFDITIDYAWHLFLQQKRHCSLSGLELSFCSIGSGELQTASLDRIDSLKPYIEGNVQWIHKDVNLMKNCLNEAHFIEMCQRISKHTNFTAESACAGGLCEVKF